MSRLVASFPKDKFEEIRFEIQRIKGKNVLDIRIYQSLEENTEKIPTGKGIAIFPADFADFKKAVLETETALREEGWLKRERE